MGNGRDIRVWFALAGVAAALAVGGCSGEEVRPPAPPPAAPSPPQAPAPATPAPEVLDPAWKPPPGDDFAAAPTATAAGEVELVIVHTNDLHGQVYPQKALWLQRTPPPDAGGISALATIIRRERGAAARERKPFLLLDAGDIWSGTPEGNLTEGRVVVRWMNPIGYDAVAIGNHEFDAGADRVEPLVRASRFPWLGANLVGQETGRVPAFARAALDRVVEGLKVTIVGLVHPETKHMSSPRATRGFEFLDPIPAAQAEVRSARARGADVVILLSHCGLDLDRALAAAVPEADAVIGGHSHQGLDPAWTHPTTKVLVAATYSKGSAVGRTTLLFDRKSGKIKAKSGKLIQVLTDEWAKDPETEALIDRDVARIRAEMSAVLGEAPETLRRRFGHESTALGNWVTDIMRESAKADVAIHNKTGLRADLAAGRVTLNDVYQVSPFGNTLVTALLTGRELRAVLEHSLVEPRHAVEASGIEVRYDLERPPGDRVIRLRIGGDNVLPDKKYRVVTNSFLAKGGEGFTWFAGGEDWRELGVEIMRLHAEDLRRRGRVVAPAEPRLGPAESTTPAAARGG